MTFSEDVRAELAAIVPRKSCCRLAELSALARTAGALHLRGRGRVGLHLDVGSAAVARRAFTLLRDFGIAAEVRTYRRRAFGTEPRYQLHLDDAPRALQVLNEAGVVDDTLAPLSAPPRRVVARACCRAAYLRGACLAAGSASGPRRPHIELRAATREGAQLLAGLAAREDVELAIVERRGHAAAYARGSESIAGLLGLMGAHDAALAIEERTVVGATRAMANRQANADHANLVRSSRAAQRQLRAIRQLQRSGRLETLDPETRAAAELRLRHPALSLRELGARAAPPVAKAAMQRRLGRIERLARE